MAVADVFDIEKKKVSQLELNDAVFGVELNEAVIYDVIKMQMASQRSGTSSTKSCASSATPAARSRRRRCEWWTRWRRRRSRRRSYQTSQGITQFTRPVAGS